MDHAATSFAHGSGTADDPYQIWAPEELALVSKQTKEGQASYYYTQMADLQMAKYEWYPIGTTAGYGGTFQGNGYTIYGMHIEDSSLDYVGMFYKLIRSGSPIGYVRNVCLKQGRFISTKSTAYVGSIIGQLGTGWGETIRDCTSDCYVSATGVAGGMVGILLQNGHIENCTFTGEVVSTGKAAGGICGQIDLNYSPAINDCKFDGHLELNSGTGYAAGIVGNCQSISNSQLTIQIARCKVDGTICGSGNIGGIVACNGRTGNAFSTTIQDCQVGANIYHFAGRDSGGYSTLGYVFVGGTPYSAHSNSFNLINCSFYGGSNESISRYGGSYFSVSYSNCYTECNGEKWYSGQSADWSGFAVVPGINGGRPIQTALYDVALGGDAEAVKQWFTNNGY